MIYIAQVVALMYVLGRLQVVGCNTWHAGITYSFVFASPPTAKAITNMKIRHISLSVMYSA